MKTAPFKYLAAGSAEEAVAALGEFGDAAKILAGGQSLLTLNELPNAQPDVLIDIGRAGLCGIVANGTLQIGATTTQNSALASSARSVEPLRAVIFSGRDSGLFYLVVERVLERAPGAGDRTVVGDLRW
jgi:CO/xanthine dehydrogenase FAD-binding subunit